MDDEIQQTGRQDKRRGENGQGARESHGNINKLSTVGK
jgi:hypothetical protein